jgi:hypothetical protein
MMNNMINQPAKAGFFMDGAPGVWFELLFEKIAGSDFSRPKGARRAAYMDVGCNLSCFKV